MRNKYLYAGLGRGEEHWQDKIASPLIYSGNVNLSLLGYEKRDNHLQARIEFTRASGKLFNSRTEKTESNAALLSAFRFSFNTHYKIKSWYNERLSWWPGYTTSASANLRINPRLQNAALGYDIFLNFGYSNRFEYVHTWKAREFKWFISRIQRQKRTLRYAWQTDLPLFTFISRQNYAGVSNFASGNVLDAMLSQLAGNMKSSFIGQTTLVRSTLEVHYPLRNNNLIRLGYVWQAYAHTAPFRESRSALSCLQISFLYKLDKNNPY